jgi:hypothetical protein
MKILTQGRYATIASTAALVVALGGTSYAAVMITGHDIKNGTLTTKDVKNHNLKLKDLSTEAKAHLKGHTGAMGAQGPAGPEGSPGAQGVRGPIGPSNAWSVRNDDDTVLTGPAKTVLTLALPAGSYVVNARATGYRISGTGVAQVACQLLDDSDFDSTVATIPSGGAVNQYQGVALQFAITRSAPTTVTMSCYDNGLTANTAVYRKKLTAFQVGTLTSTVGPDVAKAGHDHATAVRP